MPHRAPLTIALLALSLASCANPVPVLSPSDGDAIAPAIVAHIDQGGSTSALDFRGAASPSLSTLNTIAALGYLHPTDGPAVAAVVQLRVPIDCDFNAPTTLRPITSLDPGAPCGDTIEVVYEEGSGASDGLAFPAGGGDAASVTGTVTVDRQTMSGEFDLRFSGRFDVTLTDASGGQRHLVGGFDTEGMPAGP